MQKTCSLVPPPDSPLENATDPSGKAPEATLVYDGDCGFCARTVRHLRWHTGPSLEIVPSQAVLERFPGTPEEEFAAAVHMFEADGKKSKGAEAGLRALARLPGWSLPLWLYLKVAPLQKISDWGYSLIAKNRYTISSWTTRLFGPPPARRGQTLNRRLFEVLLGLATLAYAASWYSDWGQGEIDRLTWGGLGSLGICLLMLIAGWAPKVSLYGSWVALSFLPVVEYMNVRSDRAEGYLYEAVIYAALFAAPAWTARRAKNYEPSVFGLVVLRFLTLRVMVDWIPWTIRHRVFMPEWLESATWTFPLLAFGPRRLRIVGAAALVFSQITNAVQSGPRWENLFVIAMAVPLLDDAVLMSVAPSRLRERWLESLPLFRAPLHRRPIQVALSIIATALLLAIGVVNFLIQHP